MGLMFARRRIEEAQKRASLKARAQKERHTAAKKANGSPDQVPSTPPETKGTNGARNKGTN